MEVREAMTQLALAVGPGHTLRQAAKLMADPASPAARPIARAIKSERMNMAGSWAGRSSQQEMGPGQVQFMHPREQASAYFRSSGRNAGRRSSIRPSRPRCPDLGRDVFDDLHRLVARPDAAGDAMVEIAAVDQDDDIRPGAQGEFRDLVHAAKEDAELGHHFANAHHGDLGDVEEADQPFGAHRRAADADQPDSRPQRAQFRHQRRAQRVA